jgi:hypothetical protein
MGGKGRYFVDGSFNMSFTLSASDMTLPRWEVVWEFRLVGADGWRECGCG